jgi:shikimate kinase
MMGAGKSSVGRCLRRRMGLALLDIDEVVTSNFGMSIPEIFAEHGEKKFREAETEALRRVRTEEQTLFARASRKQNRPLLQTKNPRKTFSQILDARRPLYANIANIRVDTSVLTDEEVAVAILAKLRTMNPKPESPIRAKAS